MLMKNDEDWLVESYCLLVGALLDHTFVGHEGHDIAIADFEKSDDRALPILRQIMESQDADVQMMSPSQ